MGLEVELFPVIWGITTLFFIVAVQVCTLITKEEYFPYSTSLPAKDVTCVIIDLSYSDRSKIKFQSSFVCILLIAKVVQHFFKCFSATWDSSIKNLFLDLDPTFKKKYFVCWCLVTWVLSIFLMLTLLRVYGWWKSFPIL